MRGGGRDEMDDRHNHGHGQCHGLGFCHVFLLRADLMKRGEVEMAAVMRWVMDRVMVIWFSCSGLT